MNEELFVHFILPLLGLLVLLVTSAIISGN